MRDTWPSKVATDLKRVQRFYGDPSDTRIANYETELIELLKAGFLSEVTYGYQRNGSWIEPTLRYTAKDLQGMAANDDDPGRCARARTSATPAFVRS